jgi:hypothetical protein
VLPRRKRYLWLGKYAITFDWRPLPAQATQGGKS